MSLIFKIALFFDVISFVPKFVPRYNENMKMTVLFTVIFRVMRVLWWSHVPCGGSCAQTYFIFDERIGFLAIQDDYISVNQH